MVFDSGLVSDLLASAALLAAAVGAWVLACRLRADARLPLRFAAMLLAAPAAATLLDLADAVFLLVLPLAAVCLMLAALARFGRPLNGFSASLVLALVLAGGLAALLGASAMLALGPAALAALVTVAAALHGRTAMASLAGLALLAACLAFAGGGGSPGVLLFCAAALLGLARAGAPPPARSALAVEQPPAHLRHRLIDGAR